MNIKKIVLRTVPYVCIALYGTKIGQAWRLAAGTAFAEKFLHWGDGFMQAALKSRGYIVMDDILEKVPAVKMTVEVTQANYNRVSGTAYNPHFDLSQITGEGENELSVTY